MTTGMREKCRAWGCAFLLIAPAAHALCLEITESAVMRDPQTALATLNLIKDLGVKVAIDDFGVGFSSLSQLKELLPLHALKVDRSFIEKMVSGGEGNEIVRAIFKLGQALSKQVYAEGIETSAQLALLQELGCEFGQGFLLSRPVDAERAGGFVSGKYQAFAAAA